MTLRYSVLLETDDDHGVVLASVPMLDGLMTQGGSREEALANAAEAIRVSIVSERLVGGEVPEERRPPEWVAANVEVGDLAVV